MTMRGWSHEPTKNSGKLVFFSLMFFGILTYWHWEAMLISYLSTRFIVLPFNTIPELIDRTAFKIHMFPGSSYVAAFQQADDFYWKEAYRERIEPHFKPEFSEYSTQDFIRYIIDNEDAAYYDNYDSVRSYTEYEKCEIKAISAKYDTKPIAFGFQQDSPFLNLFNYYLKEMKENGALDQILKKYESGPQVCEDYSGKPLGIGSVSAAFAVLIFAFILAIVTFILEFIASFFNIPGYDTDIEADSEIFQLKKIIAKKDFELKKMREKLKIMNTLSWFPSRKSKLRK